MSEFSTQITIEAPADDVFSFVTDFDHMHEYLPTVEKATPAGDGQIRMQGEVNGRRYDTTGWFQTHEFNRTMLWGAKGANDYTGDLEVMDQGDRCTLTIHLKFEFLPEVSAEDRKKLEAHWPQIQQGLDESGQNIKRLCEESVGANVHESKGYLS